VVRLPALDLHAVAGAGLRAQALDIGQRVASVLLGLSRAEQVEIGAVEDEYFLHDEWRRAMPPL
jgi:hypothetical protein